MLLRGITFLALVLVFALGSASAAVIYTNGPTDGAFGAGYIAGGYAIADSLNVSSTTTLTSVDFTVWNNPGATPASVDWAFTTEPNTFADHATAAVTVNGVYSSAAGQGGAYAVEDVSFDVSGVQLTAGTWYLVLQNGYDSSGGRLLWDENFGPSDAYQRTVGQVGSQTFTVYGIPEPETWSLMLVGLGLVGLTQRTRPRRSNDGGGEDSARLGRFTAGRRDHLTPIFPFYALSAKKSGSRVKWNAAVSSALVTALRMR